MKTLVFVGALCIGACDDDATDDGLGDVLGDGSEAGTGAGGAASEEGQLQSGTYVGSNSQEVSDGCGIGLSFNSAQIPLDNTGTTLSLGTLYSSTTDPAWSPSAYSLGTGDWTSATDATLNVSTHVTITEGSVTCEYDLERVSQVHYTGINAVSVSLTHTESNHTEGCGELPSPCTSEYTFDLSR
jgi:hypothetical protein